MFHIEKKVKLNGVISITKADIYIFKILGLFTSSTNESSPHAEAGDSAVFIMTNSAKWINRVSEWVQN